MELPAGEWVYTSIKDQEYEDDARWVQSTKAGFDFDKGIDVYTPYDQFDVELPTNSKNCTTTQLPDDLTTNLPDTSKDIIILNGPREGEIRRLVSHVKNQANEILSKSRSSSLSTIRTIFKSGDKSLAAKLKSKQDKLLFLDKSIDRSDGDFILSAVLHMKRTLNDGLFLNLIKQRPVALQAYANYLRSTDQTEKLLDLLSFQSNAHEDVAITALRRVVKSTASLDSSSDVEKKIRMLRQCNSSYFANAPGTSKDLLDFWSLLLNDEINLLERQLPIEEEDRRIESQPTNEANAKFLEIPRKPLLGLPLITTLFYCCLYHDELPENCLASPVAIRKVFNLSEKQYSFAALVAFSLRKRWDLVDSLFQGKSWLGSKKFKAIIDFEEIARTLIKYEAPSEMVTKYVSAIEDVDLRIRFAREHRLEKVLKSVSVSSLKR